MAKSPYHCVFRIDAQNNRPILNSQSAICNKVKPMAKNPKSKIQNPKSSDVIVVGGGAMGSATAYELARRGVKTRLIEQHFIGHDLGSSHGLSRIIRRDNYNHPDYVPLADCSYALWRELEKTSGESLLTITGIIGIGTPGGRYLTGSELSCKLHDIPYERLTAAEIRKRYPFNVDDNHEGMFQKDAGILAVERCILMYRQEAKKLGAAIHELEEVLAIEPERHGAPVRVRTRKDEYTADKVVVCAGPWAGRMLKELNLPLRVERQTLGFYVPLERAPFELGALPAFLFELNADEFYYGFPFFGVDCLKVARHHGGQIVEPETVERNFTTEDDRQLKDFLKKCIPKAAGPLRMGKVCLYTNTPDKHFILDRHPHNENIVIAAGFSGHGFKFASCVGEVMADLATKGKTQHKIDLFKIARFGK
jgi:sarcosine oxidase